METTSNLWREIPELEKNRLCLRGHRLEDLDDCLALWSDPEVVRHIGGNPYSRKSVWERMLRYAAHWAWMNFGYWAVEEKSTGSFVGEVTGH